MIFISIPAISGWFGLDGREECMDEEMGEMMSRMINPLSTKDARNAARILCKKYPTKAELMLRSMSLSELQRERMRLVNAERECNKELKRKPNSYCTFFTRGTRSRINMLDNEIKRRDK